MKKKTLLIASIIKLFFGFLILSSLGIGPAWANSELDRQYSLETVGILRSWDNVDGLFADYVAAAYKSYFSHQSRFTLQDLSKTDVVLSNSKIPYNKLIEDEQILSQIARSMRSESIIRTKVYKEGAQYRFVIDWLHVPKIQLIATETFTLGDSSDHPGSSGLNGTIDFRVALEQGMERMVSRIPFQGNVTGRDGSAITVNIGDLNHVHKGDTLVIATLEEVKKHPLLKTIVDWRLVTTGKAVVEEVDEGMSFCKITDEEYGRQIGRFQKIVQIIPAPEVNVQKQGQIEVEAERKNQVDAPPRFGFVAPGIFIGNFSRTASTALDRKEGGGTIIGITGEAQLWLTRDFFFGLDYLYGTSNFTQTDIPADPAATPATPAPGANLGLTQFRFDFGYTFHQNADFFGTRGWFKAGYENTSYSLPASITEGTTSTRFGSFFIGLGGDLPIRGNYGAIMNLNFGVFNSGSQDNQFFGPSSATSSVDFFIGGYARLQPRMTLKGGLTVMSQGIDFESGATLTHKVIAIGPSLMFYF